MSAPAGNPRPLHYEQHTPVHNPHPHPSALSKPRQKLADTWSRPFPQDLADVYPTTAGKFTRRRTLLSIVAGVGIHTLASGFVHQAIIRALLNIPAQIGAGITVWTSAPAVSQTHRSFAAAIFAAMGETVYSDDEACLDMATALSGSGPAYVFLMLEALIDAGVYVGLPRETARRLTL